MKAIFAVSIIFLAALLTGCVDETGIDAQTGFDASRATAVSAQSTAQYFVGQITATKKEQDFQIMAWTVTAQAEANSQDWTKTMWTATAQAAVSTAQSGFQATTTAAQFMAEQTSLAMYARQTQDEDQIQRDARKAQATATADALTIISAQTEQAYQVEATKRYLALRSAELMNDTWAVTKWGVLIVMLSIGGFVAFVWVRASRLKWAAVYPAPNGDKPVIPMAGKLVDMDRSADAVTDPNKPRLYTPDQQLSLVAGDQRVDATRALPRVITNNIQPASQAPAQPAFLVVGPGDSPPRNLLPDPDLLTILDAEWSEKKT